MKINICIPVFNEGKNLPSFLSSLNKFMTEFYSEHINLEVIFYNDGSTDDSTEILKNCEYTVIGELNNKGLGYALNMLFNYSAQQNVDGVIKLDADGQMDVNEINLFLQKINLEQVDLIQGNRFNVSKDFKFGYIKKLGINFFRLFLRLFGIKVNDSTNGFIFVSKKWLEGYKIIGSYNGAQQILLDAKLRNLKISEIDVNIKNRKAGKSFIGIRYPLNVIASMIALTIYRRTNSFLIFPGLLTMLAGGLLFLNDLILWISRFEEKIISNNVVLLTLFIGLQMISFGLVIEFLKKQKFI